jgi:hypothetical protein
MSWKSLLVLAAVAMSLASPVFAHHSHGNYKMEEYTNLTGVIKEVHFLNPHSWIYLDVKESDGTTTTWALEGTNPTGLKRTGWDLESFKAGITISARCHQLKDGSPGCLLGFITKDGVEKTFD